MITARNYDKEIMKLIDRIKLEAKPFEDSDPVSIQKRKSKALADYKYFAKTYFPHHITRDFGEFHDELIAIPETPKTITAYAGPRGHGKSVIVADTIPIWKMLRGDIHFFVCASADEDTATERTGAIAAELQHNERIKMDFGEMLPGVVAESDFVTRANCRFLARGYKQNLRGLLHGSYRPDYIVVDDLEGHQAQNPRIAKEKKDFVREECFGALPMEPDKGVIIWLGNLTHADSALNYFKMDCENEPDNPQIRFILRKAIEDGKPLWKEAYTMEALKAIEQAIGSIGFQRHYLMNPITEGIKFRREWFKYYKRLPDHIERIVSFTDPAMGKSAQSDYRAIITLALAKGKYYLLDAWVRRDSINDMLKKMYRLDREYDTKLFMEDNLWQGLLWEFIPPMSETEGYLLPVNGVSSTVKKVERIEAITPLFEWGWILFPEERSNDLQLLEEQLLTFPQNAHDDAPDALAQAINALKTASQPMEYRGMRKQARFRL